MFGRLKNDISNLQHGINRLNEMIYKEIGKVNNLYKNDFHGYLRPKVDLLSDNLGDFETNVWNKMGELQKRVEKLEKK